MADRPRFLSDSETRTLEAFRALADGNPFLPERVEAERAALGDAFVETRRPVWHADAALDDNPNVARLAERVEVMARELRGRLADGSRAAPDELRLYEALIRYLLFARNEEEFYQLIVDDEEGRSTTKRVRAFDRCMADVDHFLRIAEVSLPFDADAAQLFAWGYQIRRAFHHLHRRIQGGSNPAARLRADVWHSIFTHDAERYRQVLLGRMGDLPTLILGRSGTGKELVARAIGLSRWIPCDAETGCFSAECSPLFHAVNLSALSTALIESELFGHRRGAFTGAVDEHAGWLERCETLGTIFLDEIGELEPVIQVKLLRVLQERVFQRVGETEDRRFEGKVVAATNRDLEAEMQAGSFRPDLYYRMCADVIHTPTLAEQLADTPDALHSLTVILARRSVGEEHADSLADEADSWIQTELGPDYPWPGNIRELEQCVRNIMIRGEYHPATSAPASASLYRDDLTADELLRIHCTRVYHKAGSYEEAARRLGLDRRTVKAKIDEDLLGRLRGR